MTLFKRYGELMQGSWFGALGAVIMVLAVFVELHEVYSNVSVAERSWGESLVLKRVSSLLFVGAVFTVRLVILTARRRLPYSVRFGSWLFALGTSFWYLWMVWVPDVPCVSEGSKTCFTIHDTFMRFDWVQTCALMMPLGSALHSFVVVLAVIQERKNFK